MSTAWGYLRGLVLSPRDTLETICARQPFGWALLLGILGYYWRMLPATEAFLDPIGVPVLGLAVNALVALGWMAQLTGLIHVSSRLLGHRRGRWRDMLLLWSYTQVPGIALIVVGGVFTFVVAPYGLRRDLGISWFAPASAVVGILLVWSMVLQFQVIRTCYGLSGWRLFGVIGLAVLLHHGVVWAEVTFVDDRAQLPARARLAMSARLCPAIAARTEMPLPLDRLAYRLRTPRRGEIVGFAGPDQADSLASIVTRVRERFLGRVVGLPGDEVEVRRGQVYLDGRPYDEPYREGRTGIDIRAVRLLPGQYFVLGDNRDVPVEEYHGGVVTGSDLRGRLTAGGWLQWWLAVETGRC